MWLTIPKISKKGGKMKDRPVTTSVSVMGSDLDYIEKHAEQKGYRSRNQLIAKILSDFVKAEKAKTQN